MNTNWHIPCGDCPHLKVESWPGGKIATRCMSPENPRGAGRVLTVLPDSTKDPGRATIRARWCHDRTEKERRK